MTESLAFFKIWDVVNIKRENMRLKTDCKDTFVLSCRLFGESTFFYKGKSQIVKRGEVLYIPHGASYSQSCQQEEIVAIHLEINGMLPDEIRVISPEDPEEMCSLFESIAQMWKEKTPDAYYRCMAALYQIVSLIHIADSTPPTEDYGPITPAVAYLQTHLLDGDLSMDAVYRQVPMSQTSFIKYFRSYFGCTPIKYVNQKRIQKAQTLLKSRLYTREEIATLCGFESVKHFYVVFKNITGCTTGEYLKRQ